MSNDFMLPKNATLMSGNFIVERQLSSGGFGNTYVVRKQLTGEILAMKEFFMKDVNLREHGKVTVSVPDNKATFDSQRRKFKEEAKRLSKIKNKHIVNVYDLFEENGTVYYTMDYIDGESLDKRKKPLKEEEVKSILVQVLDALSCVHSLKPSILHLDLKPANIMLDKQGNVYLIDFGSCKQFDDDGALSTSTGVTYTQGYAPIEQMEGAKNKLGPWTDFYALGATLYNLLTNKSPRDINIYEEESGFAFTSNVSPEMRQLIMRMMKPNRKERPQAANEIYSTETDDDTICDYDYTKVKQDEKPKPNPTPYPLRWKVVLGIMSFAVIVLFMWMVRNCKQNNPSLEPLRVGPYIQDSIAVDSTYNYDWRGFHDGLASFYKGTSMEDMTEGLFDRNGTIVIHSGKFYRISEFSEGFAFAQKDIKGRKAIIDKQGNLITDFIFDEADEFGSGVARVKKDGKWGYVDTGGNTVIDIVFDHIDRWNKDLILVKKDNKYGYIDKKGRYVVKPIYDDAVPFKDGVGIVLNENNRIAIYDKNGDMIMPFSDFVGNSVIEISQGLIPVMKPIPIASGEYVDMKYGYIDKSGKVVIDFQFARAGDFSEAGIAWVQVEEDGKYGAIDKSGNLVIPCIHDEYGRNFHKDFAEVKRNGKWCVIDKKGNFVLKTDETGDVLNEIVEEGYYAVKKGSKYGLWDCYKRKFVSDCDFDFIDEGIGMEWPVTAIKNGKHGYIDKSGEIVIDFIYDDAYEFYNGTALVVKNGKQMLIDTEGRNVFDN